MKTIDQWFAEYAESHQNKKNQLIHFVCVPAIYFSIVGLLYSIPKTYLQQVFSMDFPLLLNWALPVLMAVFVFYARLLWLLTIQMVFFSLFCLVIADFISNYFPLHWFCVILFILAWIGQFIGHHIEGKKPSFLADLQFLLIGPAWVFYKLFQIKN